MKRIILYLLLLSPLAVCSQIISGRVVEETERGDVPVPGAHIHWAGTSVGCISGEDGRFEIRSGFKEKLVVGCMGYRTDSLSVAEEGTFLKVVLVKGMELGAVDVVGRRGATRTSSHTPLVEQVITGAELCKAACCNLGESFETNAAVDVSYSDAVTGAKRIQMLGLTGKYVQMLTENMPNFRGLASLYGLNYIPGPWMSSISVSKGMGSVINGYESVAGQISVDYKKPDGEEWLAFNLFGSSERMYEVNSNIGTDLGGNWSTMLFVHGSRMDHIHDADKDGFRDMPETKQYNFMNRWAYKTEAWNLQFGMKFIDEDRKGGAVAAGPGEEPYEIGIATRRYETFMKLGYLMPRYENSSMALIANYTRHSHDSRYGKKEYGARQQTLFMNYIYQSVFGSSSAHKYSAGLSFSRDAYDEDFRDRVFESSGPLIKEKVNLAREETVAGAFFQYTGAFLDERFVFMAGIRYDRHSKFGNILTPRLHLMYKPDDMTLLKASWGKGSRVAGVLSEHSYLLASSAAIYVNGKLLAEHPEEADRLEMEKAVNCGLSFNRKFEVFGRILQLDADYYYTDFKEQTIADYETYDRIDFRNLSGRSYSRNIQAEVKYELIPRFDIHIACRYTDARATIRDESLRLPFVGRYKGLLNLTYATSMRKWQFDYTLQLNGPGRLPERKGASLPGPGEFSRFTLMNAQITKFFRHWSIYGGCENITDFTQKNPIIASTDPWGKDFDSTKVWGPVHGRKFYIGLRFSLDRD